MIDKDAAQALAQAWLDQQRPGAFIFSADEYPWGWAFMYEARKFFETTNTDFLFPDRSPVYVTRADGVFHPPIADASVIPEDQPELFAAQLAARG